MKTIHINSVKRGTSGFAVLRCWCFFDVVNKISICGVAVISNLTVCDVCVFHAAVFGEMKLFAVLWSLVWLGDAVFVNFFCGVQGPPMSPSVNTCSLSSNFFGLLKCPATILLFVENNEWSLLHENSVVNTWSKIPREMVSNSSYLWFWCMIKYANAFIC